MANHGSGLVENIPSNHGSGGYEGIFYRERERERDRTYIAQQHDVDDTTTRKSDHGKAWPPNTPGVREAERDNQQQSPHR